ncbi:hypothetical protein ACHAXA_010062 [Cyclostephanos tholiformis]|uniref:Uncharacterized protein n=1 Tax=Cyclostephanos tholiformis TaxID=382380 RepID=A0ABD3SF93_9STRA
MGLSPVHSRFRAAPPHHRALSYNAGGGGGVGGGGGGGRHVQWDDDDDDDDEKEADYDDSDEYHRYDRGVEGEQIRQETRRRRLERMEDLAKDARRDWNNRMVDAWEEAFYPRGGSGGSGGGDDGFAENAAPNDDAGNGVASSTTTMTLMTNTAMTTTKTGSAHHQAEREIQWHDYWLPPRPASRRYRVPLPLDTSMSFDDPTSDHSTCWTTWSTSYDLGYRCSVRGGGGGVVAGSGLGGGRGGGGGIAHSWREHILSESLRRVLEGCDVVKGFNIFVDGGGHCRGVTSTPNVYPTLWLGGGFHAGLAASLMEELSEECRSAGRWAVMVDPLHAQTTRAVVSRVGDDSVSGGGVTEGEQVHRFRSNLNAGLALHGLSTNADAFLPVSIDGAYHAMHSIGPSQVTATTQNRVLFEGSAAITLALEASTLFYRQRRHANAATASHYRSRIGIQSGFYQGCSSNAGYEDFDSEPFASAPSIM